MNKLIFLFFFFINFFVFAENRVVYKVKDCYIKSYESNKIIMITHDVNNKIHNLEIKIKDKKDFSYLKDMFIYLDTNLNGKADAAVSYQFRAKNSFYYNLNEVDDWSKWEVLTSLDVSLKDNLIIKFNENIFKRGDFKSNFIIKVDLKFFKDKDIWTSGGFIYDDEINKLAIDKNIQVDSLKSSSFSVKSSKFNSSRVKIISSNLSDLDELLKVYIETDKSINDITESATLRFYSKNNNLNNFSVFIKFTDYSYWIYDEINKKWFYCNLPFSDSSGFVIVIPKKLINFEENNSVYIALGLDNNGDKYYRRIFIDGKYSINFNSINNIFTEKDRIYQKADINILNKPNSIDKIYYKFHDGYHHYAVKTVSMDYTLLKEIGIYFDKNENAFSDYAVRINFEDDWMWTNDLKDNNDWNANQEIFFGAYNEGEFIEILYKTDFIKVNNPDLVIQLHFNKENDNFSQARINGNKKLSKTADGVFTDWNEKENKIFSTINNLGCIETKGLSPVKGYLSYDNDYYYFGVKNLTADYKDAETFRIFIDTNNNGLFDYDIDFSLSNQEAHIYHLNEKWDWSTNSRHNINCGMSIGEGIECYIPKKFINFNFENAFFGYEIITKVNGKNFNYTTYGSFNNEKGNIKIDGINTEWSENEVISKDQKYDNIKTNDVNIKSVYYKKIGSDNIFALDFYKPLNEYVKRIIFNIDTDNDLKNNYHISTDLIKGISYGYKPDNKDDYKIFKTLSNSKCSLTKDFFEINLHDEYFNSAKTVITIGIEYKINDEYIFDYVLAGLFFTDEKIKNYEPVCILNNGKSDYKIDIVILSDGYTVNEKDKFIAAAVKMKDAFLQNKSFSLFKDDFNFYYIFVPSKESGFYDLKNPNKIPDTVFKSGFWIEGHYSTKGLIEIHYALENIEDYECVWLVSNNNENGAGTGGWINGLGGLSVSGSAGIETPIHETGHAIFGLSDEYENEFYAKTGALESKKDNFKYIKNLAVLDEIDWTSFETYKKSLKWGWIYDYPEFKNLAGLFEGGLYVPKNVYRPEKKCIMRSGDGGNSYSRFCVVCLDAVAKWIYDKTGRVYNRSEFFKNENIFTSYDKMIMKYAGETKQLKIIKESAHYGNGTSNKTIDEDYYSMWEAGPLPAEIIYDIGKNINVGGLFLSLFQNEDKFIYKFKIFLSEDGFNYYEFYNKNNNDTAPEKGYYLQIDKKIRFIKITCDYAKSSDVFYLKDLIIFSPDIENTLLMNYEKLKR